MSPTMPLQRAIQPTCFDICTPLPLLVNLFYAKRTMY